MKTATARFERELATERATLIANLQTLEDRAHAVTDWRRQVRRRPLEAVGVALAGGVLLAMLTDHRPRRHAPTATSGADDAPRTHPLLDRLVAAFAVIAAERAMDALGLTSPSSDDEALPRRPAESTREAVP